MYEQKTKKTGASIKNFIAGVADEQKRKDSLALVRMMQDITKEKPYLWGSSIIGFGKYRYKYASGHEGDSCITGFSPRKANLTIYITPGFKEYKDLLQKLGKHKVSVGCLYIKRLSDVDTLVLKKLIAASVKDMKKK